MLDQAQLDDIGDEEEDLSSTYLTFDLGGQTLGVEVRNVLEILDRQRITRLPNAPMDVEGVVDVRGRSIPILDLGSRLGLQHGDDGDDVRILVLEINGGRKPIGVLADRVRNVEVIPTAEIEPVPSTGLDGWDTGSLQGLSRRGSDLVVLLDIGRVLGAAETEIDLSAGSGFF